MSAILPIPHLDVSTEQIAAFCQKWGIVELSVFGSVLREDFTQESDVDILYVMRPDADYGYDQWETMRLELSELMRRPVDFVSKTGLQQSKNWIRRREILGTAQVIYAA